MSLTASVPMAEYIQRRLSAILQRPDGWGPPHAVELQVLLLVEMWHVLCGAQQAEVDDVTNRFSRFLARQLPGPPLPLALRLGLTHRSSPQFVELLRQFVEEEIRWQREKTLRESARAPLFPARDRVGPGHLAEA